MTRARRKRLIIIAVLLVLLLLLGAAYWNYRATRRLGAGVVFDTAGQLQAPEYLYSFSGPDGDRLERPLGVLVDGDRVIVADGRLQRLSMFTREGRLIRHFGAGDVVTPLYVARNPATGEYYVTDRRRRAIEVFDREGAYLRDFDPKLPAEQLPKFDTGGVQWAPIALAFAPDGSLYVTEILNGHRLVIFGPDGAFKRSVGTVGMVTQAEASPGVFQFPNSVKVSGDEVWVADSNNQRLQVFTLAGDFKRMLVAEGLPRGFDFLPKLTGDKDDAPKRLVVIDTLSHDGTIWEAQGTKLLTFGERGVLEGQFSYPNDVSVAGNAYMFVADTANARIQVWGWPAEAQPIPTPRTPWQWALCGVPFLPLLLLPFLRRRRFMATRDFVEAMVAAELAHTMPDRRRRWIATPEHYDAFKDLSQEDLRMGELFEPTEHSGSDARALMDKLELDEATAVVMALAQRSKVFCTEDPELRRIARVLELDVVDRAEFVERFARKRLRGDERLP